jgi:hypothetical protein
MSNTCFSLIIHLCQKPSTYLTIHSPPHPKKNLTSVASELDRPSDRRLSAKFFFFFNLHSGGRNQGPLDTAAT